MMTTLKTLPFRRLLVLTSFLTMTGLASISASAPPTSPPVRDPEKTVDQSVQKMAEALSLSKNQKVEIREIVVARENERLALRESTGGGGRPDREKMKALDEKFNSQIEAELTKDQLPLFKEYVENEKQNKPDRKGGKRPQNGGQGRR